MPRFLVNDGGDGSLEYKLFPIQRISWYVRNNEQEFVQRVREASSLRQEEAVKDCRKQIAQAKKRHAELDGLVKLK